VASVPQTKLCLAGLHVPQCGSLLVYGQLMEITLNRDYSYHITGDFISTYVR
jgi:hypothetical protein